MGCSVGYDSYKLKNIGLVTHHHFSSLWQKFAVDLPSLEKTYTAMLSTSTVPSLLYYVHFQLTEDHTTANKATLKV